MESESIALTKNDILFRPDPTPANLIGQSRPNPLSGPTFGPQSFRTRPIHRVTTGVAEPAGDLVDVVGCFAQRVNALLVNAGLGGVQQASKCFPSTPTHSFPS